MEFAFNAHSGLRYLVLVAATTVTLYALFGLASRRPFDRAGLVLLRVFVGLLDLQVLLGILTILTRPFFSALIGHLVLMIGAVSMAHMAAVRLKKTAEAERSYKQLLVAALIPLALIIGGILAIHRAIV